MNARTHKNVDTLLNILVVSALAVTSVTFAIDLIHGHPLDLWHMISVGALFMAAGARMQYLIVLQRLLSERERQ